MARIDWTQVDLTRPTDDLMREFGCSERTILRQRTARGIPRTDKKSGGYREGSGRPKGALNHNHRESATISIRLDKEALDKVRELAAMREQSISACINDIVKRYVNGKQ